MVPASAGRASARHHKQGAFPRGKTACPLVGTAAPPSNDRKGRKAGPCEVLLRGPAFWSFFGRLTSQGHDCMRPLNKGDLEPKRMCRTETIAVSADTRPRRRLRPGATAKGRTIQERLPKPSVRRQRSMTLSKGLKVQSSRTARTEAKTPARPLSPSQSLAYIQPAVEPDAVRTTMETACQRPDRHSIETSCDFVTAATPPRTLHQIVCHSGVEEPRGTTIGSSQFAGVTE